MPSIQPSRLDPAVRSELIYRGAREQVEQRLWDVALGAQSDNDASSGFGVLAPVRSSGPFLSPLMTNLLTSPTSESSAPMAPPLAAPQKATGPVPAGDLGPNARFGGVLQRAAQRTGVPAGALAAIVQAEAAKRADGSWNTASRNPRSSAAGLGQFLAGTWLAEAERGGSYLNQVASSKGWLTAAGRVETSARSALLSLRYDAETAIETTADFAAGNLARLRRAGAKLGQSVDDIAKSAWISHHLGPGDAVRFLKGALSPERAQKLLEAQIGKAAAATKIAKVGNAVAAHRQWLSNYVSQHVKLPNFLG